MGATPNFGTNDANSVNSGMNTGVNAGAGNTGLTGNTAQNDDISFSRGGRGNTQTTDGATNARDAIDSGMNKAQDAFEQLQQKASEITARLVDNVNVEEITQKLEAQVREHPARTLLIAAGAGFVLGRALSSRGSK